ncbi:MAG: Gfo/Idh/MocA family oxidoreductase [Oscillospiraceae bacterium]|nr:Gfo/Idh/MocA family oxidoreductase [Oscillospiraceae bacterium]
MRVGLVGLGMMGSAHLTNYIKMKENGEGATLVAVCDVDEKKLNTGQATAGNLDQTSKGFDLSAYNLYTCMEEMIKKENLDFVDLCLPTHLHAPMAIKAMEMGVNVFCEKPMARSSQACNDMIEASKRTGKKLMIGHTLRYWDVYQFAKDYIDNGTFGKVTGAYFYRGGVTPIWSWENWLLRNECAGGALLDQHVHDVDTIMWMFGMPQAVSSVGKKVFPESGYDIVSTNYIYDDMVINAQDDWTINGDGYGFEMSYRMNFEKGALIYRGGKNFKVCPNEGKAFTPEFEGRNAYYDEILLFTELLAGTKTFDHIALLESHRDTILLAEAEEKSCDKKGELVKPGCGCGCSK